MNLIEEIESLSSQFRSKKQIPSERDREIAHLILRAEGDSNFVDVTVRGTQFERLAGTVSSIINLPPIYEKAATRENLTAAFAVLLGEVTNTDNA